MLIVHTIFDYKQAVPWPLATGVYNQETKKFTYVDLYRPGPNTSLLVVQKRLDAIKLLLTTKKVSVNDFGAHIRAFQIPALLSYDVYSRPGMTLVPETEKDFKLAILTAIKKAQTDGAAIWQKIDAKAQVAYAMIEKHGINDGVKINRPSFDMHTFTGRSRSRGYNVHGLGDNDIVLPRSNMHGVFLQFDWIAADLRAASILAGDKVLQNFFEHSDPYERIAEELNEDREYCKILVLKSLYSLRYDAPELRFYKKFVEWIESSVASLKKNGYLQSILGRKFYIEDSKHVEPIKKERAVFNATVQGTIAHAMNLTMARVAQDFPGNLLLDQYDSIVLTCERSQVPMLISEVGNIMLRPFKNVLKEDPTFPVRVSIGPAWRKWKPLRELR